jgi:hypothetical protein
MLSTPISIAVILAEMVQQRQPALARGVEAVGAADVGAGVEQALLARMEDEAVDEAAGAETQAAPVVAGCGVGGRGVGPGRQGGEQAGGLQQVAALHEAVLSGGGPS